MNPVEIVYREPAPGSSQLHGRVPAWGARHGFGSTLTYEIAGALLSDPIRISPRLVLADFPRWDREIEDVLKRAVDHPRGLRGLINDARAEKQASILNARNAA